MVTAMAMEDIMTDKTQSMVQPGSSQIDYEVVLDDMLKCFIRNWWRILALISLVCALTYAGARMVYHPIYTSSSTFIVKSRNSAGHDRNQYNSAVTAQLGKVFPYLLTSDLMTKLVAEDLGTDGVPGKISAEALEETSLITIRAEASKAKLSYDILQSVVRNYPEVSAYVTGDLDMELMDETGVPSEPSNPPRFRQYAALGGLAAIGVVLIILFLYAVTRMTVRSEKDLKVLFNVPALGSVPQVRFKKRSGRKDKRVAVDEKNIPYFFIESFRTIRNRLEKEASENRLKTILVTSSLPSEGKSTVAANLAVSLAHKDRKVILVDADLRNPSVGKVLGLPSVKAGTAEVLRWEVPLEKALVPYANNEKLLILPGHGSLGNPTELLNREAAHGLWERLKKMADYVIIDTPPSAVVSDASIIAKYTDGAVFVVRQDYAKLDSLQEGMEMLAGTGTRVVGTVLNGTEASVFSGGYGYGYYQYGRYGRYGYSGKYGYYGRKSGYGYGYGYGYGEGHSKEESSEKKSETGKESKTKKKREPDA